MKFTTIEPHENLDLLAWASESGRWELGFRSVLYGIRVSLSLPSDGAYTLDYCCGTDGDMLVVIFQLLRTTLLDFDETATSNEISRCFPTQNRKPIENDLDCLGELMRLGVVAAEKHQDQIEPISSRDLCSQLEQRFQANRQKLIESWSK